MTSLRLPLILLAGAATLAACSTPRDPQVVRYDVCSANAECWGFDDQPSCVGSVEEERAIYAEAGCGDTYDRAMQCLVDNPTACSKPAPRCEKYDEMLEACVGG